MTVLVPLTQGYEATIDDEDAERVLAHRWTAQVSRSVNWTRVYAKRRVAGGKNIHLHRFIMDAPAGLVVDHINGDGLDNRRANLRIATFSQNLANIKPRRNKFGYLGVLRNGTRFYAEVCCDYKIHRADGGFATAEEAAKARDKIAIRLFGEFASLNFEEHRQTLLCAQEVEGRSARSDTPFFGTEPPSPEPNSTCQEEDRPFTSVPLSMATAIGANQ